jgi:phage tail P2-like protein
MSKQIVSLLPSLLPSNASAQERALELALARISKADVPIRHLWDPMQCPVSLLPWLAWSLSVDEWDSGWPEAIQRQVIANSIPVHQIKGTVGAIRTALTGLNAEIALTEWWQNGGVPYTAELTALSRDNLDKDGDTLLTPELMAQMWRIVAATKPARSQIYFSIGVQQDASMAVAAAASAQSIGNQKVIAVVDNRLDTAPAQMSAASIAHTIGRATMAAQPITDLTGGINISLNPVKTLQINQVTMVIYE